MIVAFTGIRDVVVPCPAIAAAVSHELDAGAKEMRFGGARGSDTLALVAAGEDGDDSCRLVVIVPFRVRDQPREARAAIDHYADAVVELDRPRGHVSAYFERNERLLRGVEGRVVGQAERCVGFTDGRAGGTASTIRRARALGIATCVVPVDGGARR